MNTPRANHRLLDGIKAPAAWAALLLLVASLPAVAQGTAHRGSSSSGGSSSSAAPHHSSGSGSGSHTSTPRTAHRGTPGTPQRQPGRFNNFHRGFGHSSSFFYPRFGYYNPYYYNYYDPFYYPYYGGFGVNLLYGDFYPGSQGYYDYGYRDRYRDGYGDYTPREEKGGINLDVSPSDTQVYLDGKSIGVADDFDGWPEYLWLAPGTYDLVLYKNGFKTISKQVTIYPGQVLDMDDKMESGQSTRPEDLATKTHERRDARINYERQRSERIDRYGYDPENRREADGDWRDRARARRGDEGWRPNRDGRGDSVDDEGGGKRGRVRLDVEPNDASIYLDGRFVGTATDVARDSGSGLRLPAGQHKLAVVRPGRKAKEMNFDLAQGQELDLSVKLEAAGDR